MVTIMVQLTGEISRQQRQQQESFLPSSPSIVGECSEQDNTVSSSSSPIAGTESTGSSLYESERDLSSEIDFLEESMNARGKKSVEPQNEAHSVEYWTVGEKGRPKALVKRYHRQSKRQGRGETQFDYHAPNYCGGMLQPHLLQAPPPPPLIQVFIPPEQWTPPAAASQFAPFTPVNHFSAAAPPPPGLLFPFPQQQPYIQYYGTPLPQNTYPVTMTPASAPVSYYQGAPLYYHVPSAPMMNPAAQVSLVPSYERPLEYPPPPYEDVIPTSPSNAALNELKFSTENLWQSQNPYLTPILSPVATPSSSGTNLSDMSQTGLDGMSSTVTSGYSSCTSSPLAMTSCKINSETVETDGGAIKEVVTESIDEKAHSEEPIEVIGDKEMDSPADLNRILTDLQALNDSCVNTFRQDTIYDNVNYQGQQKLIVYPGVASILIYSQHDGNRSVILYNQKEVPYVANVFDFRVQATFKEQCGPSLTYPYYVPPRTSDDDFFGGQLPVWQLKIGQYFLKFQPHIWKMHGVPETFNTHMFLGTLMHVVGEFHIVSKLRFSCRTCKTPWTSKKGTIVFKFCFNSTLKQGWILMRIFGQICMREECRDWSFQNPACYPEEIDRAMKKLSEYIGHQCYGIEVNPNSFDECFKSIRRSGNVGNNNSGSKQREMGNIPPTPHKREFCQACSDGVCKNIFTKPFPPTMSMQM